MWNDLEGIMIADRYELQTHLATGGMAAVFRAMDHRLRRPVAIKVLRELEQADPRGIVRFRREARAVAALRSPYIVEVYDFFVDAGCYYLVLELIEGVNLKRHIADHGPLAVEDALPIAIQVCLALAEAHEHGFIHRDIKPQNILLDPSGVARLTDFGIVYMPHATSVTSSGLVLGTADYVSPEQAQGLALGPASDIYSLGAVLFEMLTGLLPYSGTTAYAVAVQHAEAPVPSARQRNPAVPPVVDRLIRRAMAKDPQQRFRSAHEMGLAIQRALATAFTPVPAAVGMSAGPTLYTHLAVTRFDPSDFPQDPDTTADTDWRALAMRLAPADLWSAEPLPIDTGGDEVSSDALALDPLAAAMDPLGLPSFSALARQIRAQGLTPTARLCITLLVAAGLLLAILLLQRVV
ncbi:MAG TPA: protein kinase [Ktedonobacterales bacterium]|nr:protein kinase [Ktedonobacterales bacterium]